MSSEENIQQERIDKELILKQWIIENPDKAKIWYAHYSGSTECDDSGINSFVNRLGTGSDANFWANGYWNGYKTWEMWLDAYEAYCEFKSKAPEEWRQLKEAKYRVYINDAAKEFLGLSGENKHAAFTTQEIIGKWTSAHQELWKEINLKYNSAIKTDEEYLYQAWMEFFHWHDTFTAWKFLNPSLWKEFRNECAQMNYFISYGGSVRDEEFIKSKWRENNPEMWKLWKEKHYTEWNNFYESHKQLLWYAYVEETWAQLSESKKNKIVNKDITVFENPDIEDLYYEMDELIYDTTQYQLEMLNENIYYHHCIIGSEEEIHESLIDNYKNDILHNPEKHSYLAQICTEYGLGQFIEHHNFSIERHIETPKCYADRKIFDIWCAENWGQWLEWKCNYCWNEKYKDLRYEWDTYFEVYKSIYREKWSEWIRQYFGQWKQEAQDIDLWFAWLSDDNELAFHQWASSHLKSWEHYIDRSMQSDCDFAYSRLFSSPTLYFKDWRENNSEEWNYWKEIIKEEILIDEFSHSNLSLPYRPEYKLQIQIQEKLYRHRMGQKIFHNHLAIICDNDKYGYINENGEIVIPLKFDYANNFCGGLALVKVNCKQMPFCGKYTSGKTFINTMKSGGQCGVINTRGEYVVKPQYDYLSSFNRGIAVFEIEGKLKKITHGDVWWYGYRDGKHGAINTRGEVVIQPVFDGLTQLENGVFIAKDHNSKKWGLLSNNTDIVGSYDVIRVLNNGLYKVNIGLNYKVVLNAFDEPVFDDYEEGRWGLLSVTGKQLTPLKYTHISNFHNGRALVNVNSQYDQLSGWSCIGGLWGYIDEKGEEVMPLIACSTYDEFLDCVTYLDYLDSLDAMAKEQSLDYNQYENWLIEQEILEEEKMEKEYQKMEDEYYSNRKQRDAMSRIRKEKNLPNLFDL